MTPEPLRLAGAHGLNLAADGWGEPGAPIVLLLHGGGQTRHAWRDTGAALARIGYRAIALDARGHGDSDWDPLGRYAIDDFAADLCEVTRTLGVAPAIVGASLGGTTLINAVGLRGLAARALVLVDIAAHLEPRGVERIVAFMAAHPDGFASLEAAAEAVAGYLPHRRRPRSLVGLRKNLRRGDDGRLRWHWDPAFLAAVRASDPAARTSEREAGARGIGAPTLLVRGRESDLLSEAGARAFLELVPHAEHVDVSGAGHMVAGDDNDRFTASVAAFLARVHPARRE